MMPGEPDSSRRPIRTRADVEAWIRQATRRDPLPNEVESIMAILRGDLPVDIGGLSVTVPISIGKSVQGMSTVEAESFHAMRESTAGGSSPPPRILVARWMLSDRHASLPSSPDACDDSANGGRQIDGTRGWYAPHEYPLAPHHCCECRQGEVRALSLEEWAAALLP